jgi:hypothetical protein
MIPTDNDFRILFEEKPEEYLELYKEELNEFMTPDEDEDPDEDEEANFDDMDAEELFEILFAIPITEDDDFCEVINILADEYLPYDVDADFEDDELVVYVDEDRYVLGSENDYAIVKKFDEIIKPDYETRVMRMSMDAANIHSLLILKSDDWKNLETKYGEKVSEYFEKIENVDFILE